MIQELALHPRTRQAGQQYVAKPSHSLLVLGPQGAGKQTLAIRLLAAVLEVEPQKLLSHPYFLHIKPQNNAIPIEAVRQAQAFVRLKTTGQGQWRRAILVEDAHYLSIEAQNAFLKLLEEPPADTLIVLTAISTTALLPTITSRAPRLDVKPVAHAELTTFFSEYSDTEVTKAYHMSGGQVGLMAAILDSQQNEKLLFYVDSAKQFLQMKQFERLVFIDQYLKQKESLEHLLWGLLAVSKAALHPAGKNEKTALVSHWQKAIQAVLWAQDSLPSHPLPKLLLTDLSLQI
jgi:replication-associated recombination protein RarA